MSRYHIIAALVLVAVVAALGLTHKFYFEEKLRAYNDADAEMKKLTERLQRIQDRFQGQSPDEYLKTINDAMVPFEEAASARAQFFNLGDFWVEEQIPEDVKVPMKFYYKDRYEERERDLQTAALTHVPQVAYPADLFQRFGAPHPASLADAAVGRDDVRKWLTQMNYGSAITQMLIKANAAAINDIVLWPPREEYNFLQMYTVGLSFWMRLEDLIAFLESLQRADRYFNVNALRIQNRNLLSDPRVPLYLEVEMLLTLSRYNQEKAEKGGPVVAAASGAMAGPGGINFNALGATLRKSRTQQQAAKKESFWEKLWPF